MGLESDISSECAYPLPAVGWCLGVPGDTLRHWFKKDLLGDGEYIRRRWKDKGELCLTPAAILAAGTVKQFRRFGYSLDFIRPATSFLANLTLKDIELAAEHDLFLVAAADVEPQFVPQDHEIVQTPGRNPPAVVLWMRQGLPKLRAALERLDAVTNEEEL